MLLQDFIKGFSTVKNEKLRIKIDSIKHALYSREQNGVSVFQHLDETYTKTQFVSKKKMGKKNNPQSFKIDPPTRRSLSLSCHLNRFFFLFLSYITRYSNVTSCNKTCTRNASSIFFSLTKDSHAKEKAKQYQTTS